MTQHSTVNALGGSMVRAASPPKVEKSTWVAVFKKPPRYGKCTCVMAPKNVAGIQAESPAMAVHTRTQSVMGRYESSLLLSRGLDKA